MPSARDIAHELAIAARIAARGVGRRLSSGTPRFAGAREFRAALEPWLAALPPEGVVAHRYLTVPASQPWLDTGLDLKPGDWVTWLAAGRVYLSRALDVWVDPSLRLWCRIGTEVSIATSSRPTS